MENSSYFYIKYKNFLLKFFKSNFKNIRQVYTFYIRVFTIFILKKIESAYKRSLNFFFLTKTELHHS